MMYKLDLYIREKLLQDFIMLQLKKKHKRATSRIFSEVNIEPIQQMINRSEKESIKFVKNQKDEFYYNKWRRYGG